MANILVLDVEPAGIQPLQSLVRSLVEQPVTAFSDSAAAVSAAASQEFDVAVIGPGTPTPEALSVAAEMVERAPEVDVIVILRQVTTELLRQAMRVGVADVVSADEDPRELADSLRRVLHQSALKREALSSQEAPPAQRGTVLTVFSPKGGVGKTVLATNLGVAMAEMGKSVALVDLDLQFGDVAIMLGLEPTHTISGPAQASDRLDEELLGGYLVVHSSGLKCLLAPVQPEEAESITPGRIARILELLRGMFDMVVVDTCASLDETVLTALDRSDHVLAITMMDVASIKNTRISLQKLHQLGYAGDNVDIVLNRSDSKVFLQPAQIEKAIGRRISVHIPSDRIVPQSVNKGVPVVSEYPRSDVARALMGVAHRVVELHERAVSSDVA